MKSNKRITSRFFLVQVWAFAVLLSLSAMPIARADSNSDVIANSVCQSEPGYVGCFSWSLEDCQRKAIEALRTCRQYASSVSLSRLIENDEKKWAMFLASCTDVALGIQFKERIQLECRANVQSRAEHFGQEYQSTSLATSLRRSISAQGLQEFIDLGSRKTKHFWFEVFAIVSFGLLASLPISFLFWRAEPPSVFPTKLCWLLFVPGIFSALVMPQFVFDTGVTSQQLHGDNPGAAMGMMFGLMVFIGVYWLSQFVLFRFLRKTA